MTQNVPMAASERRHVAVHLDGTTAAVLDEIRAVWDPIMMRRCPPHVTLAYPEEVVDEELLQRRLGAVVTRYEPFEIGFAAVAADDGGAGGVWIEVMDPSGSLQAIRTELLRPPMELKGWPFHTTLVHPRTSPRGPDAWVSLRGASVTMGTALVRELLWTATNDVRRTVLRHFPLGPGQATPP